MTLLATWTGRRRSGAGALPRLGARRLPSAKWAIRRTPEATNVRRMESRRIRRIGLVVHPRREIGDALDALTAWCEAHGAELVQVPAQGQEREIAEPGDPASCDLIVALGGDGTTLAAVRTGAEAGRPVLGAACGSLGALTTVPAEELAMALDRVEAGDWLPRKLPSLIVRHEDVKRTAVNDLVVVRQGAGQVSVSVRIDDELFTPVRRRRLRDRHAARVQRLHARRGRPAARARHARHGLHAARTARRLHPAARHRPRRTAGRRDRPRPRRRTAGARRADRRPAGAARAGAGERHARARARRRSSRSATTSR